MMRRRISILLIFAAVLTSLVGANVSQAAVQGIPIGPPGSPSAIAGATDTTAATSSVTVSWNYPSTDGGDSLTVFQVTLTDGTNTFYCSVTAASVYDSTTAGSCLVSGLAFNTTYNISVTASNSTSTSDPGTGRVTTPAKPQTITVTGAPSLPTYGIPDFPLTGTATSALAVAWSSGSPSVCTVDAVTGIVHVLAAGTCVINADQNGLGSPYSAALQVSTPIVIAPNMDTSTVLVADPTGVQGTTAIMNGTISYPGLSTTPSFCISTTASFPTGCALPSGVTIGSSSPNLVTATSSTSISATASGLSNSTTYYYWIVATNSGGSVTSSSYATFTTLAGPTIVISAGSPTGTVNTPMTLSFTASGGSGDYSAWDFGTIPTGLTFNPNVSTADITGTPTVATSGASYVSVTDSLNQSATIPFTWNITDTPPAPPGGGGSSGGGGSVITTPTKPADTSTATTKTTTPTPKPTSPSSTDSGTASNGDNSASNSQPTKQMKMIATFHFGLNSYALTPAVKTAIKIIAKRIMSINTSLILIYGNTDAQGGVNNALLSKRRAAAVEAYIRPLLPHRAIRVGWNADRKPAVAGTSAAAYAQNRRVEIWIR